MAGFETLLWGLIGTERDKVQISDTRVLTRGTDIEVMTSIYQASGSHLLEKSRSVLTFFLEFIQTTSIHPSSGSGSSSPDVGTSTSKVLRIKRISA